MYDTNMDMYAVEEAMRDGVTLFSISFLYCF